MPSSFLATHWKLALIVFHILSKVYSDNPKAKRFVLQLNCHIKWENLNVSKLGGRGGSQALGDRETSQARCLVGEASPSLFNFCHPAEGLPAYAVGVLPITGLHSVCQQLLNWKHLEVSGWGLSLPAVQSRKQVQGTYSSRRNPQQMKNRSLWINTLVSLLLKEDNSEECSTQPSQRSPVPVAPIGNLHKNAPVLPSFSSQSGFSSFLSGLWEVNFSINYLNPNTCLGAWVSKGNI